MVPCLHQSNVYIKRKLRVWRVQKWIPLVCAKTTLTCVGPQTTPSDVMRYRSENGNSGLLFAVIPCLHQSNVFISRKIRIWSVQKCISLVGAKTAPICVGLQTTPSHVRQYRAENGNLRKFGSTFRHGTVFAPKQCSYQKEATGMKCPKMYSSSLCKNRTYLCGPANYPISCEAVLSQERKFVEIRVYLSTWYHVCAKAMFISKESYGYGMSKNVFLMSVQ